MVKILHGMMIALCRDTIILQIKTLLKNWSHTIYGMLSGLPNSTHIKAKKLLFQGSDECWEYFERTAVFNGLII